MKIVDCAVVGWVCAALACLGSVAAAATPVHYVVFEMSQDGRVSPLHYARVEMQADAEALLAAQTVAASGHDAVVDYHLRQHGVDLGARQLRLPLLRGEFARDPGRDDSIVAAPVDDSAPRAFVLRVPVDAADAIEFGSGAAAQTFDLATLARQATQLREARLPQLQVQRASASGPAANRVDLLVFAEGYTAAQQALFNADVALLHDGLFALTPYKDYESHMNWTPVFAVSAQAGADHPPYQAGCTGTNCCADTAAQSDPRAGQFVNTAFNARFCAYQVHRLLTVNNALVLAAAAAYPDWDAIVVLVNDPVYGGSGGDLSVTSTNIYAREIVLHEYGHSFTGLADEYSDPYPGFPACSDLAGSAQCEANVTNQTNAALVKWRAWFTPGNPIPTPAGTTGVGLFQGARYLSSGMYRPVDSQCQMRMLGQPFCPVCRQEYVRKLYAGGWGVPSGGISPIEPGSASPPTTQPVDYVPGTLRTFSVDLLWPSVGTLDTQWWLDGVRIVGPWTASYPFVQATPTPATRTLEVRVRDPSPYVAGNLPTYTRSWTIHVDAERIFTDGFD